MDCIAKLKPGGMYEALVGPDPSNSVLMRVPGGIQFPVKRTFGPKDGIMWYELATPQGPGWLNQSQLNLIGDGCPQPEVQDEALSLDLAQPPAVTPPATARVLGEFALKLAIVNDNGVRVRQSPDANGAVLHPGLRKGTEAEWLESSTDGAWHKVRLYSYPERIEGWITAEFANLQELTEKIASVNQSVQPGEVILDVPYHSQEDTDAKYAWADCGPTSMRMIIAWNAVRQGLPNPELTIDEVSRTVGIGPKEFSHFAMLIPAGRKFGLEFYHTNQATIPRIKREIDAGRPVLQLVRYGSYSGRQHTRFTAGHFMVVTGYNDTHMIVNDPYWAAPRREEGQYWQIPLAEFEHSIGPEGSALAGNMPYQALFLDPRAL